MRKQKVSNAPSNSSTKDRMSRIDRENFSDREGYITASMVSGYESSDEENEFFQEVTKKVVAKQRKKQQQHDRDQRKRDRGAVEVTCQT